MAQTTWRLCLHWYVAIVVIVVELSMRLTDRVDGRVWSNECCVFVSLYADTNTHARAPTHTQTHTNTHTRAHTHTYTETRTHTLHFTSICLCFPSVRPQSKIGALHRSMGHVDEAAAVLLRAHEIIDGKVCRCMHTSVAACVGRTW
jgi:hypothetical protein